MKQRRNQNGRTRRPKVRWLLLSLTVLALAIAGWFAWRPLLLEYRLVRGRQALENRDPRRALQHFHHALQLSPDRPMTHLQMARAHRRLGQLDRVRQCLEQVWQRGCDLPTLEREQWLVLAETGQLRDVEHRLLDLLAGPDEERREEICEALVRGYFINLRFAEASQALDAWEKDFPNDAEPHFMRGYLWKAIYRYSDAISQYELGLERSPHRTDARLRLAEVLVLENKFERAEAEFRRCLKEQPSDLNVQIQWAAYLFSASRLDEARGMLDDILSRAPNQPYALRLMGQTELAASRPQEALRWLLAAADQSPQETELRYALGKALQANGQGEEAQRHFDYVREADQQLRQLDFWLPEILERPEDVLLRYKIGLVILRYSSPEDGVRWLKTALETDPNHRPTHLALAEYYRKIGDLRAAEQHRRLAQSSPEKKSQSD